MLTAKKERMERLIASIDDILKGENKMDKAAGKISAALLTFRAAMIIIKSNDLKRAI